MICENCGKEHDGSYASGRFCSKECAHSYVTKLDNKKELKESKCIDCGKIIYINKRSSNKCRCDSCQKNHIMPSQIKTCSICGSTYIKSDGCKNEFCKNHNWQQFKSLIKYFGFDKTKYGTLEVENEFNRIRDILYDLYWNQQLSASDIGKIYNYKNSHNIIQNIFNFLNIPTRNYKESVINAYLQGKMDLTNNVCGYKDCWHITWNNKEVYLRSSYELDYAKELDKQQIDYEVEFKYIKYWDSQKQEYRCAIPDFYIPKDNMIVEIKSSYTLNKQNMKDKMKAYKELGYNFKLICDHKELKI